jgi:hypothetical protein
MTEAQRWRRIGRWVAEQPVFFSYLLPDHLGMTQPMRERLCDHVSLVRLYPFSWKFAWKNAAQFQTYIIMRCELLALEAEEEGR